MEIPSKTILLFTSEEKIYSELAMFFLIKCIIGPKPQHSLESLLRSVS